MLTAEIANLLGASLSKIYGHSGVKPNPLSLGYKPAIVYEAEAHAFRRWVLSQPISGDWKKATQERLSASRSQKNAEASKKENGNTNDEPILVEPPHIENLPAVVKDFRIDGLCIDEIAVRVGITRLQVFEILNANA